jgi:hypothetical protein
VNWKYWRHVAQFACHLNAAAAFVALVSMPPAIAQNAMAPAAEAPRKIIVW